MFKCENHKNVDEVLSCIAIQLKSKPLGRMLYKDYQLDAIKGYLVRFCLKIKIHRGAAHHWTAFLPITKSWAKSKVIYTHTHTHTHKTALT
jgi:hypothetical protein